jgi:hypothetical protein
VKSSHFTRAMGPDISAPTKINAGADSAEAFRGQPRL